MNLSGPFKASKSNDTKVKQYLKFKLNYMWSLTDEKSLFQAMEYACYLNVPVIEVISQI